MYINNNKFIPKKGFFECSNKFSYFTKEEESANIKDKIMNVIKSIEVNDVKNKEIF